jgi:hypothetical protein
VAVNFNDFRSERLGAAYVIWKLKKVNLQYNFDSHKIYRFKDYLFIHVQKHILLNSFPFNIRRIRTRPHFNQFFICDKEASCCLARMRKLSILVLIASSFIATLVTVAHAFSPFVALQEFLVVRVDGYR